MIRLRVAEGSKRQYSLLIDEKPVGKESVRVSKNIGRTADKSRAFMESVKWIAKAEHVKPMDCCIVDLYICVPIRVGPNGEELEPKKRPDEDNVRKGCKDALQGISYSNDAHVIWGHSGYVFLDAGEKPRTLVVITECEWTEFRHRGPVRVEYSLKERPIGESSL